MKTKVLIVLALIATTSINCIAQGLENRLSKGIFGQPTCVKLNRNEPNRNPSYGVDYIFNSGYFPSADIINYEMTPQFVTNRMIHTDEVTEEQVRLIFNRTKDLPEDTEISIAFINNGQIAFYGLKRQKHTVINIDNRSSVFEIGSITKVFTATLLADYVINGLIILDDPINNYLPIELNKDIQISFKGLANHTSGLPRIPSNLLVSAIFNTKNPYKNYSEDKLEKYLTEKARVSRESVKSYDYSNLGFGLLGYALSKIENKGYNDLLKEKIFLKYGMMNTSTLISELESYLVPGLNKNGYKTPNWDFASLESAGAILSTTEDLSKFAVAQFDKLNEELALTREISYTINETKAIGLAWFIRKAESGDILYWHKGVTGGYTSVMAIDINKKTGLVILSNVSGFSKNKEKIEALCFELMITIQ